MAALRTAMAVGVLLLVLLVDAEPVWCQDDGAPVQMGTYRVIESKALGETRRLLVHLPRGYEGSAISYPVVYHTYGSYLTYYADAYSTLELLGEEARTPQLILVGIDNIDRYRDLRPLQRDGSPAGIGNYTRFLTEEVIPFVEREYRTAPYRVLVGPQAGGVFCLHTLIHHPDTFDAFILNNPLVSDPNTVLLLRQAETFFRTPKSGGKFFYVTYGAADESPEDVTNIARLAELARPAREAGFDLRLNDVSGNDEFIPPLCLKEGLRTLFADYHVPRDRHFGSLAEVKAFYGALSERFGFDVAPAEFTMTGSADAMLERGEYAAAREILDYQTGLYPKMLNGWWRLAGLAARTGDKAAAIELYQKCVEIDPSMKNFVERRIDALQKDE